MAIPNQNLINETVVHFSKYRKKPIVFKGVLYEGKHDPLITKELFDLTQLAFRKDNKPKHVTAKEFLFSGMIKCANCGCNL